MRDKSIDPHVLGGIVTGLPAQSDLTQTEKDDLLVRALQEASNQGLTLQQSSPHTFSFKKGATKSDKHEGV